MLKAIIADKETDAIGQMEAMLSDLWPELVICGKAGSGPEALKLIERHKPQIAILEVRLPEICGMQVARLITDACQVIFTTHYDHYAVNAFDSGAMDYLLKPVQPDRLEKALNRVKEKLASYTSPPPNPVHTLQSRPKEKDRHYLKWICTQNANHSKLIPVDRIFYFKADHKYTVAIAGNKEILISKSIKRLVQELDPTLFWQIHRSTIVNISHIDTVSRSKTGRGLIQLKNHLEILTVSRPYLHLFKKM